MSEKSTTISQIFHALTQTAYRHASIPYKNRFETYIPFAPPFALEGVYTGPIDLYSGDLQEAGTPKV